MGFLPKVQLLLAKQLRYEQPGQEQKEEYVYISTRLLF